MKFNKKIMCFMLTGLLVAGNSINAFASQLNSNESIELNNPANINIEVFEDTGFVIITEEVSSSEAIGTEFDEFALVEKETSRQFRHSIKDRNGKVLATALSTVTGWYSSLDNWSSITNISVSFSGTYANSFTYKVNASSGNTRSVTLYFNGVEAGTLNYKISTSGTITNY